MEFDIHTIRLVLWVLLKPIRKALTRSDKPITRSSIPLHPEPVTRNPVIVPVITPEREVLKLRHPRKVVHTRICVVMTFTIIQPDYKYSEHITRTFYQMDKPLSEFTKRCHDCVLELETLGYHLINIQVNHHKYIPRVRKEFIHLNKK